MTCTRCLHLIRLTGGSYSRLPGCSCGHYTHHNRVSSPRNTCLLTCIRCLLPPFVSPAADTTAASQAAHAATALITTVCDDSHPQQPMPSVAMPLLCNAGHPCRCRCPRLIRLTVLPAHASCRRGLRLSRLTCGSYSRRLPGCSCSHYTHHNRMRSPCNACLLTCIRCLLPIRLTSQAAHAATTLIITVCDNVHPQQPMPSVAMPLLCCAGHPCRCRCPRLIRLTATSACLLLVDVA
jgi:hypothetical protein